MSYFADCSTQEEVRARYRELLQLHHPDVGGDPAVARQINVEYQRYRRTGYVGRVSIPDKTYYPVDRLIYAIQDPRNPVKIVACAIQDDSNIVGFSTPITARRSMTFAVALAPDELVALRRRAARHLGGYQIVMYEDELNALHERSAEYRKTRKKVKS